MNKKPKILVVSYNFPRPDKSSGELRFMSILEILTEFWNLDFCIADSHATWNASEEMIPYIEKLEEKGIHVFKPIKESFSDVVQQHHYDGAYFNLYWIAEEVMPLFKIAQPSAFIIVDSVDVHFAREETQAKLGVIEQSQVLQTKERELAVYRAADIVIAVSKDDFELLALKEGLSNVFLIPNVVKEYSRVKGKRNPIVVFIGGFAWYPNPEAVKWFAEQIWPEVYNTHPTAQFLIIGSDPTPNVLALANVPGIKVLGYVPETKPYLDIAAVSVAPLRIGGGMKGKVNEAMAHGVPIVATTIGAQGFGAIHGKHMMIADDPGKFSACVINLLDDDELQREVGLAGQRLNSAICSFTVVKEKISELTDHCSGLISFRTTRPGQSLFITLSTKFFLFIKDIGYAIRLLKREGINSFIKRTGMYVKGQRLPAESTVSSTIPTNSSPPINHSLIISDHGISHSVLEFPVVNAPLVSIIIPAYNQWNFTYTCLDSVLKNSAGISYEVIVADDNSYDDTSLIKNFVKNIQVIRNETNFGFLLNCNNAARFATGKHIVFLNNDAVVQPEWLKWLIKTMEENPDIGLAGAKLIFSTGELQEAGGIVYRDGSASNYGRLDWPGLSQYNYFKDVDYCSGACLCVKKELWDKSGGFDPIFSPGYYDDTDLAMQIRKMGYRTVYQPRSVIFHFEGISHGSSLTDGIKSNQPKNQRVFAEKWKNELEKNHYLRNENLFRARDKSKDRPVVLLIDYSVPSASSEVDQQKYIRITGCLAAKGLKAVIFPENFLKTEPYVTDLEQKGIEVLYGRWYSENWWLWITENAANINTVIFIDQQIADKYLPLFKNIVVTDFNIVVINKDMELNISDIL